MSTFFAYFLTIAVGFVSAGLVSSFYELVTAKKVTFAMMNQKLPNVLLSVPLLAFAAPNVIMRGAHNSIRQRGATRLLGFSAILACACAWAFVLGGFLLDLAVR